MSLEKISVPAHISEVIRRLEEKGFEAWCVGGCVRDSLLGNSPHDWDLTTAALPQEVKDCFPEFGTVDTGIRHGTVTLLLPEGPVEITTFRVDGGYRDNRHPELVRFSMNLREDLSRRDFTINAMAYEEKKGLADPFHGREDLEHKLLRCVGDPRRRFSEDALRILRALRFASRLGFSIEEETRKAAWMERKRMQALSQERICSEIKGLLCGAYASQVLRENREILFEVLPELIPMVSCTQENPFHCFTVWEHTLHVLDASPRDFVVRMAALLHDCGKPACKTIGENGVAHFYGHTKESAAQAAKILERLRCSKKESEEILELVRAHGQELPFTPGRVKKLLNRLGETQLFRLFSLLRADLSGQPSSLWEERSRWILEGERMAGEILEQRECFSLKDLAVNGRDLLQLGFPGDRRLGEALSRLLGAVQEGELPNEKEVLLAKAEELLRL